MNPEVLTHQDLEDLLELKYNRKNSVYVQQFRDLYQPDITQDELSLYDQDPDAQLIRMHGRYLSYVADRRILLRHPEHGYYSVPYVVRGTAYYHDNTTDKLEDIRYEWDCRPGRDHAMFITISPRAIGSVWRLHSSIKSLWPSFMDWLRKRFGISQYVWAMEPTKRHYSHYHLVTQGRHQKGRMAKAILAWWQGHGIDIDHPGVDVQYARTDPVKYALKYVAKGTTDVFWSSMLWLSGGRIWGRSVGLGGGWGENNSETSLWECLGVIEMMYLEQIMKGLLEWEDIGQLRYTLDHPT